MPKAIMPVEVKAEESLKSKSLSVFVEKFKPRLACRSSMSAYREPRTRLDDEYSAVRD